MDLKKTIVTAPKVECPVRGCDKWVERQRTSHLARDDAYYCPEHGIYISPSTFEYAAEAENLLWHDPEDQDYLSRLREVKRESRMARERSEDALTWNVFRYLQRQKQLETWIGYITEARTVGSDVIYWSFSDNEHCTWSRLKEARKTFDEHPDKGSEPDLILVTDHTLLFVEIKFTSSNYKPVDRLDKLTKYGTHAWYDEVFSRDIRYVAYDQQCYELMRFWLLGTRMAANMQRNFLLLSLTPEVVDPDVEERFGSLIRSGIERQFRKLTWERMYGWLEDNNSNSPDYDKVLAYLRHKSAGYKQGLLQPAFRFDHSIS